MNFRRVLVKVVAFCLPLVFIVVSCKKKKAFKEENGQSSEDVRSFQAQNDEVARDINIAIMEQSLLRGRSAGEQDASAVSTELCGLTVDTLSVFEGITRLHYNGVSCNGTKKTGDIIITIEGYPLKKWKHPGCVLRVDFVAYKVTRSTGKSVQLDGTEYFTNQSGGTWYDMRYLNASNLVQVQTAENLKLTFDGGNTALFNINRRMTFNYTSLAATCKIEGLGSSNGINNLENWGQDREGNTFTTEVLSPVFWKSSCGSSSPLEGEVSVKVQGKDFEMNCRYGVDQEGNVSGDNSCAYGWKVSWSYKKKTNTRVFAYN